MDTAGDDRTVAAANICAHRADHGLVDQDDGGAPPSPAAKPSHSMRGGFAANHTGRRSRAGGAGAGAGCCCATVGWHAVSGAGRWNRCRPLRTELHCACISTCGVAINHYFGGSVSAPARSSQSVRPRLPLTVFVLYNSY